MKTWCNNSFTEACLLLGTVSDVSNMAHYGSFSTNIEKSKPIQSIQSMLGKVCASPYLYTSSDISSEKTSL